VNLNRSVIGPDTSIAVRICIAMNVWSLPVKFTVLYCASIAGIAIVDVISGEIESEVTVTKSKSEVAKAGTPAQKRTMTIFRLDVTTTNHRNNKSPRRHHHFAHQDS
jgi:hypothetical protein